MVQEALASLMTLMRPDLLGLMIVGLSIGMIPGILPGIGGATTIALALPFTMMLSDLQSLVLLCSLYTGVAFGGSITSILLGIPGGGGSVPVMFDGHRMAKAGNADHALGASLGATTTGNIIGSCFLIFLIVPMASVALMFGPPEMLMVVSLAVLMIGTIRGESAIKGILAGVFGIMVGTIGISPAGAERGVMGSIYLIDGLPTIALLVAMFTIPGIVEMCTVPTIQRTSHEGSSLRKLLYGMGAPLRYPFAAIPSGIFGLWIGILPAVGGSVSSIGSYSMGRSISPRGHQFGTGDGHEEGIVYCETASGADEGGSLATLFVLGIPGGSTSAAMLGALILQGWAVGPKMVFDHWDVIRTVTWALLVQAILLIPVGLAYCFFAWRMVKIKTTVLVPMVAAVMVVGVYATRQEPLDVLVAVAFGAFAWLMQKTDYPPLNFVIGMLLGDVMEGELVRTFATFSGRWELMFQRPLTIILIVALALMFTLTLRSEAKRRSREKAELQRMQQAPAE
jgi:putative tricarboxylic transport membrane protein